MKSDDLVQQARSADAAEALVDLTYSQSRMMLAGAIIGFFTLIAALAAATFAKLAADHTRTGAAEAKRAADAAEDSVAHASRTSRAELRAYIVSEKEAVTWDAADPCKASLVFILRNVGSTPAENLHGEVRTYFRYVGGAVERVMDFDFRNGTTARNGTAEIRHKITLTKKARTALERGKGRLFIDLRAHFTDAFEDKWDYVHDLNIHDDSVETGLIYTLDNRHVYMGREGEDGGEDQQPTLALRGGSDA